MAKSQKTTARSKTASAKRHPPARATKATAKRAKSKRNSRATPDPRLVKALAHPLRMRILARLNEDTLSPAELAREFDLSLPLVSYHVATLRDLDCIELVSTTPVRGAVEHHYRATRRAYFDDNEWERLSTDVKQSMTGAVLRDAISDALDALQTGQMDRRNDRHVSFTTLNLDETAWKELNRRLYNLVMSAMELQAESAVRLAKNGAEPVRSRLTVLHYEPVAERPSTGVEPARRKTRRAKKR